MSPRRQQIAVLYAHGFTGPQLAEALGIAESTIRDALKTIRRGYAAAGIDVSSKVKLARQLHAEGLLR